MEKFANRNNSGSVHAKSPHTASLLTDIRCNDSRPPTTKKPLTTLEKLEKSYEGFQLGVKALNIADGCHKLVCGKFQKAASSQRRIGVFTSGPDVQGMNAALRAVVRTGQFLERQVFYIKDGYQGMVDGGDSIVEATRASTHSILPVGGSVIGSGSCPDFKRREGRLNAAKNLAMRGITYLVCIGNVGSLNGLSVLLQEWPSLMKELRDRDLEMSYKYRDQPNPHLNCVAVVSSESNTCCGTDLTLGANSALHRVLATVDAITLTSSSHRRVVVLEVMGKNRGYLTLIAGISCEASAIFIKEDPPSDNWRKTLCDVITGKLTSESDRRTHVVLVTEDAMDSEGIPIRPGDIIEGLRSRLSIDTQHITLADSLQRAGKTSAMDRLQGVRLGVEAVLTLCQMVQSRPAYVIATAGEELVKVPLLKIIDMNRRMDTEMSEGNYDYVTKIRGSMYLSSLYMYHHVASSHLHPAPSTKHPPPRLAMVVLGRPVGGVNAAARGFVSVCLRHRYRPLFILDGWEGLVKDKVKEVVWNDVTRWTTEGGSKLGASRLTAAKVGMTEIARQVAYYKVSGIVIVGGFEAFQSANEIASRRLDYPELCVPITVIPATFANNVPGCQRALGIDTALNQVCQVCDDLKLSASSTQNVLNLVEVQGENCGYLATMAAIATGADKVFIREAPFSTRDIQTTCERIRAKFQLTGGHTSLIICNQRANVNITTDVIHRIFNQESRGDFNCRKVILGPTQLSMNSSVVDRQLGTSLGVRAAAWLVGVCEQGGARDGKMYTDSPSTVTLTTINDSSVGAPVTIDDLTDVTDFKHQVPTSLWWLPLRLLPTALSPASGLTPCDIEQEDRTVTTSTY